MKIILLGYMASGKSTIGKEVSKKLYMNFIDLDTFIEKRENQSISAIFKVKGEIYFRSIERRYLKELLNSDADFVLSLGGGTPCYGDNMALILASEATSVYIKAGIPALVSRLTAEKSNRPLIANLADDKIQEFVAKHLFERRFFYEQADIILPTNAHSIAEITTALRIALH
ncbi:shikimate kinase [uncultured Polaribacter sp.]|uniref:shikimate kinase n=1 Tax=uncultured Polaribacter sp. TaxID=174711 RepID=UPI000ADAB3EF|nr:shikimate kinase [Polaribacter sp.]|tara:strand:- start:807 stop:1322 length:516 start_codon:yes stop_codon:yes gene_type:complete